MSDVKVTDQCVEMRRVLRFAGVQPVLQYRSLRICVDASGALCPNGYTDWIDVEMVISMPVINDTKEGRKDE